VKVIYLAPGTGGTFYCQNCVRDTTLVRALRLHGHDVTLVPVYLPILLDAADVTGDVPVFFGGINVYLQQKLRLFRRTPRWLDKLFDAGPLLRMAAAHEGATEAAHLGSMTLSVLKGEEGNQKKELDRLLDWLEQHERPDLIHISNALLLGLARGLKQRLGIPIVCSLQDEENWINEMRPPHDQLCWEAMSVRAADVDLFVAVSDWYGREMCHRMRLDASRMRVVPPGIELDEREPAPLSFDPPVIGFLSKMGESLGLGTLVDAFIALKLQPGLAALKLRATGGQHGPDAAFIRGLHKKLKAKGMDSDVEFIAGFDLKTRRAFLRSLTVLSVPAKMGEAFGLHIIEALTEGVPVVQPRAGAYPEVIERTGGGVLYDPDAPDGLADALASLLLDPARARGLGRQGREAVIRDYTVTRMAREMADLYESLV